MNYYLLRFTYVKSLPLLRFECRLSSFLLFDEC